MPSQTKHVSDCEAKPVDACACAWLAAGGANHPSWASMSLQASLGIGSKAMLAPPVWTLNLQNTDERGRVVAHYDVPADQVKKVLDHILFKAIPFDHSSAFLGLMMNVFYPTDNDYTGTELGYYRQREWRLTETGIAFHGHPMTRLLTANERKA